MEPSGPVHFGATPMPPQDRAATGRLTRAFGEPGYVIEDVQTLAPFLVTLVSDADVWLFAASNGSLTAGRGSPATALFPYVTEDKLYDAAGVTGPVTSVVVTRDGRRSLWRPLDDGDRRVYRIRRRLFKSLTGTRLVYQEDNADLGLRFTAGWRASGRYGLLRECALENLGEGPVEATVLDGLLNLLPAHTDEQLQRESSVLLDAYKQAERLEGTALAVFTLAAQPVDRPEPKEALRATTVWSEGLPGARVHLDPRARAAFEAADPAGPGGAGAPAEATRGLRGAHLIEAAVPLPPGGARAWILGADVARSQAEVAALLEAARTPAALAEAAREDAARGAARVEALVAATDGRQATGDPEACAHHLANVLFNDLRGGVFAEGGAVPGPDFAAFVRAANRTVWARHRAVLEALPAAEPRAAHAARVEAVGDPDLLRLSEEYLPLWFSRRHGDPSRPWNRFHIRVQDDRGAPVLDYQGNWRDIFQNWEALARSFPDFAEHMLAKFVNASTADGHNPYRIGRAGVDWEVPDPDHPWSTIGYWGDHQLVYLLRLLELSLAHHPARVPARLEARRFTYADVPYAFRPFAELLENPRDTLRFDRERHARILARAQALGSDGRLLPGEDGPLRVTLAEKLLVPALAKLANLVPGAGLWMNTQRPEWNDANNALPGYGVSTVTLFHLDRYLEVFGGLLDALPGPATPLSSEVADWLEGTLGVLEAHAGTARLDRVDDDARGALMRGLGEVAADYRARVYAEGFSGTAEVPVARLRALVARARAFTAQAVRLARRDDGLFHAYQVLVPRADGRSFGVEPLPEMLEGQVAALSSRAVDDARACELLDALWESRLVRRDQDSFLLYPDRALPGFLEKNVVPEEVLARSPVLARLLDEARGAVLVRDVAGRVRFAPDLWNAEALRGRLEALRAEGAVAVSEADAVEAVYEEVFRHRAFTGRSGTMFAYEGLGSIYWHMVGKLLLAVQERLVEAAGRGAPPAVLARLARHHEALRRGLGGASKSPAEWGAFPLDAYSHTPAAGGARQPGLTGQVKEAVLIRLGELGVVLEDGRVAFRPRLLRPVEWLEAAETFEVIRPGGGREALTLEPGTLGFTLCQVPIVYHRGEAPRVQVTDADGATRTLEGDALDSATSAALFGRTGEVTRVDVWVEG